MNKLSAYTLFLAFLFPCVPLYAEEVSASPWLSDKEIQKITADYTLAQLKQRFDFDMDVSVSTIDPRLKLKRCDNLLTLSFHQDNNQQPFGRNTVKITCDDINSWAIYVPIQINAWKNIPTLAGTIKKGQILSLSDLTLQRQNLANLPNGYLEDPSFITGRAATRNLMAGAVLFANSLVEPDLIKRGDRVILTVYSPSVRVSTNVLAQENGKLGQSITVENISSNQKITAKVVNQGTVSLSL